MEEEQARRRRAERGDGLDGEGDVLRDVVRVEVDRLWLHVEAVARGDVQGAPENARVVDGRRHRRTGRDLLLVEGDAADVVAHGVVPPIAPVEICMAAALPATITRRRSGTFACTLKVRNGSAATPYCC